MTDDNTQTELAKVAYQAYGDTTGWKNFQGNPMPQWEDLGDMIQAAWVNASQAVATYLQGPEPADFILMPID